MTKSNASLDSPGPRCPKCGAPLDDAVSGDLCPACLMGAVAAPTEPQAAPEPAPLIEDLAASFPQLEIVELIGKGGMGAVYKARQPHLDRWVALKILPANLSHDAAFAERFTREARVLARLNHPNIVTLHDFGQSGNYFYLLMEYVDGVNLRQAISAGGFTPEQALEIVPRICEALQFAHSQGILHRDIKPANILLDTSGRVKIADFGIAKVLGQEDVEGQQTSNQTAAELTGASSTLGTPSYMAPEQLTEPSAVDHRADIYSLGVVFYEMLTGELPQGRFRPPSGSAKVDHRIDDVVKRALAEQREARQQSADEMRTEVETITANPAPSPTTPPSLKVAVTAFLLILGGLATPFLTFVGARAEIEKRRAANYELDAQRQTQGALLNQQIAELKDQMEVEPDRETMIELQQRIDSLQQQGDDLEQDFNRKVSTAPESSLLMIGLQLLLIGSLAVFAPLATWLGWRYLAGLRASHSRQGIGMAMFSALLIPLLVQSAIIITLIMVPVSAGRWQNKALIEKAALSFAIALSLWLGWRLIGKTWRWVTRQEAPPRSGPSPWPRRILVGCAIMAGILIIMIAGLVLSYQRAEAKPTFSKAATVGNGDASAYCAARDDEMDYTLFYAGDFSVSSSGHRKGDGSWQEEARLTLPDKNYVIIQRNHRTPDRLHLNGFAYFLTRGRMFLISDEAEITQYSLDGGVIHDQEDLRRLTDILRTHVPEFSLDDNQ